LLLLAVSVLPSCAVYDASLLDTHAGVTGPGDGGGDSTGMAGGSATGGESNSAQGGNASSTSHNGGSGNDGGSSVAGGGATASGGVGSGSAGATNNGGTGSASGGGAPSGGSASAGAAQGGAVGSGSTGSGGAPSGGAPSGGAPSGGSAGGGGVPINPCDRTKWKATASESSVSPNNPPAYAIDGSTSTRWSTGAVQVGGEWFLLDLGARAAHLTQVVLDASTSTGDEPLKYKLEVSDDGKTFALVCTGIGAPTTAIKFVDTPARYIRITQTGSAADANWWSIQELTLTCSPN
jgi:hypothetical protein